MTKTDLVDKLYDNFGYSRAECAELVEIFFDSIKETLAAGEEIKISGFGVWQVRDKEKRTGRNPQTGQELEIAARRVVTFKPSQVLRDHLNING